MKEKLIKFLGGVKSTRDIPDIFRRYGIFYDKIKKILKKPAILLNKSFSFSLSEIKILHDEFIKIFRERPNIMDLGAISNNFSDILIVGDVHGDLVSLLKILDPFLIEKIDSVLFLGDYVDRGKYSLHTLLFLIILGICWPNRICLLRGNHEDVKLNQSFGFSQQLMRKYPSEFIPLSEMLTEIYHHFSLVAITPNKTIGMHAGVPVSTQSKSEIEKIKKPHNQIRQSSTAFKAFMEIRWNDPIEEITRKSGNRSYHGFFYYTPEHVENFLEVFGGVRIVKSHETKRGGFEYMFGGRLIHIFSSKVSEEIRNAYIIHERPNGIIHRKTIDHENSHLLKTRFAM